MLNQLIRPEVVSEPIFVAIAIIHLAKDDRITNSGSFLNGILIPLGCNDRKLATLRAAMPMAALILSVTVDAALSNVSAFCLRRFWPRQSLKAVIPAPTVFA